MNCQNCGAPMELFARRRHFFCRHCGSFHFLDAPEIDGLRLLARSGHERACSICKGALARALFDEAHAVEYCERCRGVLMSRGSFADIVTRRRAWASSVPVEPLPMDRIELERRVRCPSCQGPMETHPYFGPGNVVMDSCEPCGLVWLDFGELDQIVAAPGRDRGRRDSPPPRDTGRAGPPDTNVDAVNPHRSSGVHLIDVLTDLFG